MYFSAGIGGGVGEAKGKGMKPEKMKILGPNRYIYLVLRLFAF
jgi:hypothetical protein